MLEQLRAARKVRALPSPITITDEYLASLLEAVNFQTDALELTLVDLTTSVNRLADAISVNGGERSALTEVIRKPNSLSGEPLPEDIPGYKWLREAGIETVADLPHRPEDLRQLRGIGSKTAADILHYLSLRSTL